MKHCIWYEKIQYNNISTRYQSVGNTKNWTSTEIPILTSINTPSFSINIPCQLSWKNHQIKKITTISLKTCSFSVIYIILLFFVSRTVGDFELNSWVESSVNTTGSYPTQNQTERCSCCIVWTVIFIFFVMFRPVSRGNYRLRLRVFCSECIQIQTNHGMLHVHCQKVRSLLPALAKLSFLWLKVERKAYYWPIVLDQTKEKNKLLGLFVPPVDCFSFNFFFLNNHGRNLAT